MTTGEQSAKNQDDAVEQLLAQAKPRPAPAPDVAAAARAAVKSEWQRTVRRRSYTRYAVAASVLLAAFAWFAAPTSAPTDVPVLASIDKLVGEFSVVLDDGVVEARDDTASLVSGETILTDSDSGLALRWHDGGSLRVDANTSLRITGPDSVELRHGRIYFDSEADGIANPTLIIQTTFGELRHLGTQYMVDLRDTETLRVSVREGEVDIDGRFHDARVNSGKQVMLQGDRQPVEVSLATHSSEWQWVNLVAPAVNLDGKTFYEVLRWASREMGMTFRFASEDAEHAAHLTTLSLSKIGDGDPMATLRAGAAAAQLTLEQSGGELVVSERGQ